MDQQELKCYMKGPMTFLFEAIHLAENLFMDRIQN